MSLETARCCALYFCEVLKCILMLSPFYDERNVKLMEKLMLPCVTMQKLT